MTTFNELYAVAKEELEAVIHGLHITDADNDAIRDHISEIAYSNVPIFSSDIVEVFSDGNISYEMNDVGLIEGSTDVLHIMRMRIYEELTERLYEDLEDCVEAYVKVLNDDNYEEDTEEV